MVFVSSALLVFLVDSAVTADPFSMDSVAYNGYMKYLLDKHVFTVLEIFCYRDSLQSLSYTDSL